MYIIKKFMVQTGCSLIGF